MRKATFLSAVALAVSAMPAAAQEPGSRQTREFLQAAAQSDQFELLEGNVVLTQSKDAQVRAFATQMIHDHEGTSQALQDTAVRAGLKPAEKGLSDDQARLLGALQSLRGKELDQAYWRHQALAHRSALTVEQAYAAGGDVPAVRQLAASATPLIAGHLGMAERMLAQAGEP